MTTSWDVGTASVNNGETNVTFQSANLSSSLTQAGDLFMAAGHSIPFASVNLVAGTAVLKRPWPGTSRTAAAYDILYVSDNTRLTKAIADFLAATLSAVIGALKALTPAANKAAYFTGANTAALHDQTAFGRAIQALTGVNGSFLKATGANSAALQAIVGTVSQSAGVATGAIIEQGSNANGEYVRFADGMQICTKTVTGSATVTAGGGLFYSGAIAGGAYAAAFTARPSLVTADGMITANNYTILAVDATQTAFGTWRIGAPATAASSAYTLRLMAIGRWF